MHLFDVSHSSDFKVFGQLFQIAINTRSHVDTLVQSKAIIFRYSGCKLPVSSIIINYRGFRPGFELPRTNTFGSACPPRIHAKLTKQHGNYNRNTYGMSVVYENLDLAYSIFKLELQFHNKICGKQAIVRERKLKWKDLLYYQLLPLGRRIIKNLI